ncbi:hypothetical protein [Streptomyces sp. NRRL F-2580]|uniref:hypothetical protein n=1 Tax=Streptomyces sp. NRRL F-2580 TaxID=1463841 RepID=UPI00131D6E70|nr:hypothetical protein [Streptomyces sp. NRRL F-2580]
MLILRWMKARNRDLFPATTSTAAVLPLAVTLPALTAMLGGRLGAFATIALIVGSLVLIAGTAALAAREARDRAERARRDAAVLDALEPLAGLRR